MPTLRPQKSVSSNFRRVVPRMLRRYFQRGDDLVARRASNEKLHGFRIRTKRVRYTLELYAEVFSGMLERPIRRVQQIQQLLGELQDQATLQAFVASQMRGNSRLAGRYSQVLAASREQQQLRRERFFDKWKKLKKAKFLQKLLARISGMA